MTADVFIASFLGCLLALAVVAIGVWQAMAYKARRFMKKNSGDLASWLESSADGDPEIRAELDRMVRRRAHRSVGDAAYAAVCDRPGCRRSQMIPAEIKFGVESDAWLAMLGWHISRSAGARAITTCPICATDANAAAVQ